MIRFLAAVLAGAVAAIALVAASVRAAGTGWSLLIVAGVLAVAFFCDWFSERRPSRLTPLQRFERREAERRRAA